MTFKERLEGLLGGQSQIGNFGLGLLANSGPVPVGTRSTGQSIANAAQFASQRQRDAQQNEFLRQRASQEQARAEALQKRTGAQEQLAGLLGRPNAVPQGQPLPPGQGVQATQQQIDPNQFQGLLAQASPEAFIAHQFARGQQERVPTSVLEARAFGFPETPQGLELLGQAKAAGGTDDEIRNRLLLLQTQSAEREAKAEDRSAAEAIRFEEVSTDATFRTIKKVSDLSRRLAPTILATGTPFNTLVRDGISIEAPFFEALGFDTRDRQRAVEDFDKLTKALADLQLRAASLQSGNPRTNQTFNAVREASASLGVSPGAIDDILISTTNSLIDATKISGTNPSSLQEMLQFVGGPDQGVGAGDLIDLPGLLSSAGAQAAQLGGQISQGAQSAAGAVQNAAAQVPGLAQQAGGAIQNAGGQVAQGAQELLQSQGVQNAISSTQGALQQLPGQAQALAQQAGGAAQSAGGQVAQGAQNLLQNEGVQNAIANAQGALQQIPGQAQALSQQAAAQAQAAAQSATLSVKAISELTRETVKDLPQDISNFSARQRAALEKRLEELGF